MNEIITFLQKRGYQTLDSAFYTEIDSWKDWFTNGVDEFHKNTFFNGTANVENNILQLGMAKTVCETWANLLYNEKVAIKVDKEEHQKKLNEVLEKNNFRMRANQLIELAFSFGTGAFVTFLKNNEVAIDYISADKIFPLSWENGEIKECAFGSMCVENKEKLYYVQLHLLRDGVYVVENYKFKMDKDNIIYASLGDIAETWETKSTVPMFNIIKPNIVNNVDIDCPMGVSVYANAIDILKELDVTFDSLNNDYITGRRMVFMKNELFTFNKDGQEVNVISRKENIIRWMGESEDGELMKEFSPNLRADDHIKGIQFQLNLLSQKCGMGSNQFEFSNNGVKTATEVISENSDLYSNLKKHELALENPVKELARNILFLKGCTDCAISVDFDDSIIEDTEAIKKLAMQEFNMGLIDKVEYFMKTRNLTEEQATKHVQEMKSRLQKEPPQEE